jgi:hypothetical protein
MRLGNAPVAMGPRVRVRVRQVGLTRVVGAKDLRMDRRFGTAGTGLLVLHCGQDQYHHGDYQHPQPDPAETLLAKILQECRGPSHGALSRLLTTGPHLHSYRYYQ